MKKLLILGSGYIGSDIIYSLSNKCEITCIDHGKNFQILHEKCPYVNFIKGDISDNDLIKKYAPKIVEGTKRLKEWVEIG